MKSDSTVLFGVAACLVSATTVGMAVVARHKAETTAPPKLVTFSPNQLTLEGDPKKGRVYGEFVLRNEGASEVTIADVSSTCTCGGLAEKPPKNIPPHSSVKLKVFGEPPYASEQQARLTVTFGTKGVESLSLPMVVKATTAVPTFAQRGDGQFPIGDFRLTPTKALVAEFETIEKTGDQPFVTSVKADSDLIAVKLLDSSAGREAPGGIYARTHRMEIAFKKPIPNGNIQEKIVFYHDDAVIRRAVVRGLKLPAVELSERAMGWGKIGPLDVKEQTIRGRTPDGKEAEVEIWIPDDFKKWLTVEKVGLGKRIVLRENPPKSLSGEGMGITNFGTRELQPISMFIGVAKPKTPNEK